MKAKTIKGYPVVSLDDGSLLGRVQDLTIDPADKKVAGLVVGEKGFIKGKMQFIPFQQVLNIGKDVIIIQSKEGLLSQEEQPQEELFSERSFIGHSVISNEGDYIAKIQDFTFSAETGAMESLLLYDIRAQEKTSKNVYLDINGVIKLGKDYVIVEPDYTSYLREEDREEEPGRIKFPVYSLEMRAIEFALDKEAAHTVKDIHGEVIIEKGEKITPEVIDNARSKGRLYQVLFAAGVGELLDSIDYTVEKLDQGSTLLLQAWQSLKNKSRYILKGPAGQEKKTEEKEAPPQEPKAAEEPVRSQQTDEKTSPATDLLDNIKEIVSRLEEEISRGGKELARESMEMMKNFMLHKKANYTVKDSQGNLLVEAGGEITEEIIQAAEAQNKVPALFLSVAAQEVEESLKIIGEKISSLFR